MYLVRNMAALMYMDLEDKFNNVFTNLNFMFSTNEDNQIRWHRRSLLNGDNQYKYMRRISDEVGSLLPATYDPNDTQYTYFPNGSSLHVLTHKRSFAAYSKR